MEHVHTEDVSVRDDDSSPHPPENPTTPPIQADLSLLTPNRKESDPEYPAWPSLPPPTTESKYADESQSLGHETSRLKPLFRGFERPSFSRIAILVVLCFITYPAFYILKLVARDKPLFVVRLLVSTWCSVVGFCLGYLLLSIGAQHLEATTWASVIHMSYEGGGMKLRDLARGSDNPTSFIPAFHILWSRFADRETFRRSRKSYDKQPWSLFLGLFAVLAILAPLLPFIFGRIIVINTFVANQHRVYREVLIAGDLTQGDVVQSVTEGIILLSDDIAAFDTAEFGYGDDTIYFAQPSLSQFVPGGSGAGTFNPPLRMGLKGIPNNIPALTGKNAPKRGNGAVLRYPQWGVRIRCAKLPNPEVDLAIPPATQFNPRDGFIFVPRDFLQGLFGLYGIDLPTELTKLDLSPTEADDDGLLKALSKVDRSTLSYYSPTGTGRGAVTVVSRRPYPTGDQGWVTVETLIIHLNTSSTPSGRFPAYSTQTFTDDEGVNATGTAWFQIGHDAAVCVQKYEPWIIEAYNASTGSSFALQIVGRGNDGTSLSPSGNIRGARIVNTRYLNTTGKDIPFYAAHNKSVARMGEAGLNYGSNLIPAAPTPVVISFTDGTESEGYTGLSADRFAVIRARVTAANTLPYLAGSGLVVAQLYEDEVLAYATYEQWQLIVPLILVLILGIIGELFVPKLPLQIPRRGFGIYSWLALFQSQELQFEAADDLDKLMSLEEIEEKFSDKRVKFVVENK